MPVRRCRPGAQESRTCYEPKQQTCDNECKYYGTGVSCDCVSHGCLLCTALRRAEAGNFCWGRAFLKSFVSSQIAKASGALARNSYVSPFTAQTVSMRSPIVSDQPTFSRVTGQAPVRCKPAIIIGHERPGETPAVPAIPRITDTVVVQTTVADYVKRNPGHPRRESLPQYRERSRSPDPDLFRRPGFP